MTLLFDFDGTLVDSMPTYSKIMTDLLDEYGASYPEEIIKIITPLGFIGTADYYIKTLGVNESRETLVQKMTERAIEAYTYRIPAKAHVIEALRTLCEGGASLNVLTASPHDTLDPCLKRLGLWELFDNVWSCNDFGTSKSDPEIYRMAAEKMGCDVSDAIFLDDNIGADLTAKEAGMRVIGVFDESTAEMECEMRRVLDGYIRDFSEIGNAIRLLNV